MMGHIKPFLICLCFAVSFSPRAGLAAQTAKPAPVAPIPVQLLTATKLFVGNAGEDNGAFGEPIFKGGPQRAYEQFYAALKDWGHYTLVATPANADLVLEIGVSAPSLSEEAVRRNTIGPTGPYDPQIRLTIRDPKSGAVLWTLIEHVRWATLQTNRDKNFDHALSQVVSDLQALSGSSSPETSKGHKPQSRFLACFCPLPGVNNSQRR